MKHPTVSVIIPVYNASKTIEETIKSILAQTFNDFELILVDDGSTDNSAAIISSFQDDRIYYYYQENSGIAKALNYAVSKSRGMYIARLDADDIAVYSRLDIQVKYMQKYRLDLLGTAITYIDDSGNLLGRTFPITWPFLLKKLMADNNVFAHPSIMFTKNIFNLVGGYDERLSGTMEDYELWHRIIGVGRFRNLHLPLTKYRISERQITSWIQSNEYKTIQSKVLLNKTESNIRELNRIKCRDKSSSINKVSDRKSDISNNIFYSIYKSICCMKINENISSCIVCFVRGCYFMLRQALKWLL